MSEASIARLLVVDDEAPLVRALDGTLSQEGYRVVGVTSPAAALEKLRAEKFELLLTDLEMPGMDGIELLRTALTIDPELTPIVMTGHGTIETAVEAMKSGALDYIVKPFKLSVVLPVLSRALAVRRLRRENQELTANLKRRTQELELANKDLEAFSYSVSHDLRAPLRAIGGFSEILATDLSEGATESNCGLLQRIHAGVDRMNRLIDDLLRLSRALQSEVRRGPVDLAALAREIAEKLQADAPSRKVRWSIPRELRVLGDLGLLKVVMENLLSNAWKYSGKIEAAEIEVGSEIGSKGEPVYFVRDNGAGFDLRFAERLFAPFQRFHSEREFPGTGVGLATVHRLVSKHGGRIWADSAPGQGATFRFTLQ